MRARPLIALLVLSACNKSAPRDERGEDFLAAPAPSTDAGPKGPASFEGAAQALLRDGDLQGWTLKQGPDLYNSSNLYEVINGAGAGYLAYGFKQMAKADYAPQGVELTEDVVVEAYQMTSPLAAYGKWSEERASCDPPAQDKPPGCSRGSDRVFHKGAWFVKVTTYDDSPAAVKELHRIAEAIAKRTPGDSQAPADASRLPTTSRKPHSVVYRPKALLGLEGLGNGFQADYTLDDAEWSLLFKRTPSAGEAAAVLGRLRNDAAQAGFAKEGTAVQAVAGVGEEALAVETTAGWIVVARQGTLVAGGVEFSSRQAGVVATQEMLTATPTNPQ